MKRVGRLVRYGAVSAVSTVVSLTVLGTLVFTRSVGAGWANVAATAAGTIPSFELNRRWVWGKCGRRSLWREIGPFCLMSFAGLALSTVAVTIAARWATTAGLDRGMRTLLVEMANASAFGSLWIAQFVVLDRVLFGDGPAVVPALPSEPSEPSERSEPSEPSEPSPAA